MADFSRAGIAQLVERNLAKVEVASSRLVSRSISNFGFFAALTTVPLTKITAPEIRLK